ncbi:MAG: amino acid permease [Proteobacteria bacterium]|nr:amino acid permease [Pseudomonadota bacterium]
MSGAAAHRMGLWTCVALVVGNTIGSGIFMLPASLAEFGMNSMIAWGLTAGGALCLAYVFSQLSHAFPRAGGPYAYTQEAFGPFVAFIVAWGYWVSIWVGNAAIATGTISYLTPLFPRLAAMPGASVALTLGILWLLTLVNCRGIRASSWVQNVTTVLKVAPLLAIAGFALFYVKPADFSRNAAIPISAGGITAAATLTLWGLLGLESATIPADKVVDPSRTIPRATLYGTLGTALIYVIACGAVLVLLPTAQLKASTAPFADVARLFWGERSAQVLAAFAAISGFGCLNGWILLQGELPCVMARNGVFPKLLARTSARGTPDTAMIFGSILVTALVLMNASKSMVEIFTFMILLSTTACLVMYTLCSAALLRLAWAGRMPATSWALSLIGALALAYSLWTLVGAGTRAVGWGLVLLLAGVPVFALMRQVNR